MSYGICNTCKDQPFEDIQTHKLEVHKNKKVLDAELFSGTIECKVCRQMVETPRRAEGKWKEPPEHTCVPANVIKDPNTSRIVDIVDDGGMDLRNQKIILRPTGY